MLRRFGCGALLLAYVSAGRVARYWAHERANEAGEGVRSTSIVGAGRVGALVAKRLLDNAGARAPPGRVPRQGAARRHDSPSSACRSPARAGISTRRSSATASSRSSITFSTAPDDVLLRIVRRCEDLGIPTAIVPRLFERMPELTQMEHLGGLPLVTPRPATADGWQFRVKYAFDRVLAASRAAPPVAAPARGRRSRRCSRSAGPCSSGRCASAATGGRSRC